MADDNRFKGLRDELEKEESEADQANETTPTKAKDNTNEEEKEENAAFPFDATEQKSVYALPETFEDLDDAEFNVQVKLRKNHDVRDVKRREFFDAALQVAAEHPDEVAKRILQGREDDE